MMIPFIATERLDLCPLGEWILNGNYVHWLNDAEVQKFNSHGRFPYGVEQARTWIQNRMESKDHLSLAMVLKSNGLHIGNLALQDIDLINRSADFAIMLGEMDYAGQGLAREAANALIQHGFDQLGLHRISCATSAENIPMQKLALALGMQKEGIRKDALYKNGRFGDLIEYGLVVNP